MRMFDGFELCGDGDGVRRGEGLEFGGAMLYVCTWDEFSIFEKPYT